MELFELFVITISIFGILSIIGCIFEYLNSKEKNQEKKEKEYTIRVGKTKYTETEKEKMILK